MHIPRRFSRDALFMLLIQLQTFRQVVELRSLSRAAIKLGISQSAVSRHVQSLEQEFQAPLFYRHGRGVVQTDAGRYLYEAVSPMLDNLVTVRERIIDESAAVMGSVTLGLPASLACTIGAGVAAKFRLSWPKATLQVYEGSSGLLLEWLGAGRLDMAVLYQARTNSSLLATPLLLEDLFLVSSPLRQSAGESISIEALRDIPMILPGPQSGLRRAVDHAFQQRGITINLQMELHSVTTVKQLVEDGEGLTVLPFGAVFREVAAGRLFAQRIDSREMMAMLVCASAKGLPFTRAGRFALHLINDAVREAVSAGRLRGEVLAPVRRFQYPVEA